jgi:hypothetical protein
LRHIQFQTKSFTAKSSLEDFDLSSNKSLRSLKIPVNSVKGLIRKGLLDTASRLYKYALSTIKSPAFSRVIALYREGDFHPLRFSALPPRRELTKDEKAEEASWYHKRFELLLEVHKVRYFTLELHADVWERNLECAVRMLEEAVAAEKERGGFDNLFRGPFVTFHHHTFLRSAFGTLKNS